MIEKEGMNYSEKKCLVPKINKQPITEKKNQFNQFSDILTNKQKKRRQLNGRKN